MRNQLISLPELSVMIISEDVFDEIQIKINSQTTNLL